MRMKTLATLASDTPTGGGSSNSSRKRRRGGDDDDDFGANDSDWGVYRTVGEPGAGSDDDEEPEDLDAEMTTLEAQLLKYDPDFTEENTLAASLDWSKSLMHAFLRGPRPYDPESPAERMQIHLNVERIRVPECVFQPSIAGVDQAGLVDIVGELVNGGFGMGTGGSEADGASLLLRDIFLTGGNTLFAGFEDRLAQELRAVLPADAELKIRGARDPIGDAWRGAAMWAREQQDAAGGAGAGVRGGKGSLFVSKEEWAEKGGEYLKARLIFYLAMLFERKEPLSSTLPSILTVFPPIFANLIRTSSSQSQRNEYRATCELTLGVFVQEHNMGNLNPVI